MEGWFWYATIHAFAGLFLGAVGFVVVWPIEWFLCWHPRCKFVVGAMLMFGYTVWMVT